jgi:ribose transport system ATP-binding protein
VFELADRVSVLRDGALVGTRRIAETNENDLIALMINRSIEQIYHKDASIRRDDARDRVAFRSGFQRRFDHRARGEIVGLYGLIGAGRSEFVQSLFGRFAATAARSSGRAPVAIRSERQAMDLGIALAPESRRDQGLCLNLGVGFNIAADLRAA